MQRRGLIRYEIVVKDRLSSRFGHAFPGVEIEPEPGGPC